MVGGAAARHTALVEPLCAACGQPVTAQLGPDPHLMGDCKGSLYCVPCWDACIAASEFVTLPACVHIRALIFVLSESVGCKCPKPRWNCYLDSVKAAQYKAILDGIKVAQLVGASKGGRRLHIIVSFFSQERERPQRAVSPPHPAPPAAARAPVPSPSTALKPSCDKCHRVLVQPKDVPFLTLHNSAGNTCTSQFCEMCWVSWIQKALDGR